MDNSQLLDNFNNLNETTNSNQEMIKSAESIIEIVKNSKEMGNIQTEKYKLYQGLIVTQDQEQEVKLYCLRRLIGGILSSGLEMRKGFCLTLKLLLNLLKKHLNYGKLIETIEKESQFKRSDSKHFINCMVSGKILIYELLLPEIISNNESESLTKIIKILCPLMFSFKNFDKALLFILENIFESLKEKEEKILKKNISVILYEIDKHINKTSFIHNKELNSQALILLLFKEMISNKENTISNILFNYLPKNSQIQLFEENFVMSFFSNILSNFDKDFHISLEFFFDILKKLNDKKIVYTLWNVLIDEKNTEKLKAVSLKLYQNLILIFTNFVLENFFFFEYVEQIFDFSFFENLIRFPNSNMKQKYLLKMFENLLKNIKNEENNKKSNYLKEFLNLFGNDSSVSISPKTFKSILIEIFNNLTKEDKINYIDKTFKELDENEFFLGSLKNLIQSKESEIEEEITQKILSNLIEKMSEITSNQEEFYDLEDNLIFFVILLQRKTLENNKESQAKFVKNIVEIHKIIQQLYKTQKIELDDSDYKNYIKQYKAFTKIISNFNEKKKTLQKEQKETIYSLLKISLIYLLVLPFHVESSYHEDLSDLVELTNNLIEGKLKKWNEVLVDTLLSVLNKGISKFVCFLIFLDNLNEYIMNVFKRMSSDLNEKAVNVLFEFLGDDLNNPKEEGKNKKKKKTKGKGKKMEIDDQEEQEKDEVPELVNDEDDEEDEDN